jgi:hypothetical protein
MKQLQEKPYFSKPIIRLAVAVTGLMFLTSSFDLFLVINLGGNFRLCQLLVPILFALALVRVVRREEIPTLGAPSLVAWLAVQVLFIPNSSFWPKSVGYCLWLLMSLAIIFSFVQLFGNNSRTLITVLRLYILSFGAVALFGIVQFTLPMLGFEAPFVTQWWIPGSLPRVNGFSYEPSYFATYLLIGFVLIGSLRRGKSSLLPPQIFFLAYCLPAIGIIISSSRMGIAFVLIDVLLTQVRPWFWFFKDLTHSRISRNTVRALLPSSVLVGAIVLITIWSVQLLDRNPAIALIFLNGTGISDTAAHSVVQREGALSDTLTVFLQHPLGGVSLGGISSGIAALHGEAVQSFEASKNFEGMSVFAEALAASGAIGIIPFLSFLITIIRNPLKLAFRVAPFYRTLLHALLRSLLFGWGVLQFNQNMLRPYLWVHIAMLATVYAAARESTSQTRS